MPEQLDQNVVALMKAISKQESGNRAVLPAEGAQVGGASIYQYTTGTWKGTAQKYLGNANAPLTRANENQATYKKIKEWKDAGYRPEQIASMWNAGEGEPNAYKGKFETNTSTHKAGDPSVGTNQWGVGYSVPGHAQKVMANYNAEVAKIIQSRPQVQQPQPVEQTPEKGTILQRAGSFITKDILGGGVQGETNLGGEIFRSTLGSRGAAGVGQEVAKNLYSLASGGAYEKEAAALSQSQTGLADQTTKLIKSLPTITDPVRQANLKKLIKENLDTLAQSNITYKDLVETTGALETPQESAKQYGTSAANAILTGFTGSGSAAQAVGKSLVGKASVETLSKFPTLLPAAEKALTFGKGVLPRAIEQAGIGAGFTASENIRTGKPITENVGTGALFGAAFPVAGTVAGQVNKSLIAPARNKVATSLINSLIKPLLKDFEYGKDIARGVLKYVPAFNSFDDGIVKTQEALNVLKEKQKSILQNPIIANEKISVQSEIQGIYDKYIKNAVKSNDETLVKRLTKEKDAITYEMTSDAAGNIIPIKVRNLDNLTPQEAAEINSFIGSLRKWTGNPSEDKAAVKFIGEVYGTIKSKLNGLSDKYALNLNEVNQGLSDLITAKNAMQYRDKILQRQNIFGLTSKISAYGLGSLGVIFANPMALVAGVATLGIDKVLGSAAFKTRLAKFLATSSAKDISILRQSNVLNNILNRIFGQENKTNLNENKIKQIIEDYVNQQPKNKLLPPGSSSAAPIELNGQNFGKSGALPQPNIPLGKQVPRPGQKMLPIRASQEPIITPPPTTVEGQVVSPSDVRTNPLPIKKSNLIISDFVSTDDFTKSIQGAKKSEFLTVYQPEEYKGMKTFLGADKKSGYAIKPDGDLVSVFNYGEKGQGPKLVKEAIANGAKKLDAFEGWLTKDFYPKFGFKEVKRVPWNDTYAPKNWDYKTYKRPDIIYMELK